jgi:hypothetical protein
VCTCVRCRASWLMSHRCIPCTWAHGISAYARLSCPRSSMLLSNMLTMQWLTSGLFAVLVFHSSSCSWGCLMLHLLFAALLCWPGVCTALLDMALLCSPCNATVLHRAAIWECSTPVWACTEEVPDSCKSCICSLDTCRHCPVKGGPAVIAEAAHSLSCRMCQHALMHVLLFLAASRLQWYDLTHYASQGHVGIALERFCFGLHLFSFVVVTVDL